MTPTTLPALLDALKTYIATHTPALKSVSAYETLEETTKPPYALVELTDMTPAGNAGNMGTGQLATKFSFSIYVFGKTKDGAKTKIAIRDLALGIAGALNGENIGVPSSPALVKGIYPDIIKAGGYDAGGANGAGFVEVQRIDIELTAAINPSVWDWSPENVTFEITGDVGTPESPII